MPPPSVHMLSDDFYTSGGRGEIPNDITYCLSQGGSITDEAADLLEITVFVRCFGLGSGTGSVGRIGSP
jgi:hypothetical protein